MNQYDEAARDLIKAVNSWMQKADEDRLKLDFSSVFIHYAKKAFSRKCEWWKISFMKPKFLIFSLSGRKISSVRFFYEDNNPTVISIKDAINKAINSAISSEIHYTDKAKSLGIDKQQRNVLSCEDYTLVPRRDMNKDEISINEGSSIISKLKNTYGYLTKDGKEWQPHYDEDDEFTSLQKSASNFMINTSLQKLENFDFTKPLVEKNTDIDWSNFPNIPEFSLETKQIINTIENFKF